MKLPDGSEVICDSEVRYASEVSPPAKSNLVGEGLAPPERREHQGALPRRQPSAPCHDIKSCLVAVKLPDGSEVICDSEVRYVSEVSPPAKSNLVGEGLAPPEVKNLFHSKGTLH